MHKEYAPEEKETMEKQFEKLVKKHGEDAVRLREVSDVQVGSKVYHGDKLYGTVVGESDVLLHILKPGSVIPNPFEKESFESYLKEEYFIIKE